MAYIKGIKINNPVSAYGDVSTQRNTAFSVPANGGKDIDLTPFLISIPPSLTMSISAKVSSGTAANVEATLTYYEDI